MPDRIDRRDFGRWILAALATAAAWALSGQKPARGLVTAAPRPVPSGREAFVQRALEMRRIAIETGDQPFGAVVVKDGRIVGEAPSRVIVNGDPTAHAEMEAIRDAARRLGMRDLSGCEMYSSSRPCRMCEPAAYWANISRLYYGSPVTDGGAPQHGC